MINASSFWQMRDSGSSISFYKVALSWSRSVINWFDCRWVMLVSFFTLFDLWILSVGLARRRYMWRLSLSVFFLAIIWVLWSERNVRFFDSRSSSDSLIDKVGFLGVLPSYVQGSSIISRHVKLKNYSLSLGCVLS